MKIDSRADERIFDGDFWLGDTISLVIYETCVDDVKGP